MAYAFDFEEAEDTADTSPWLTATQSQLLLISDTPEYSRSGARSLRLKLNLQPYGANPDGGVFLDIAKYPPLKSQTVIAAQGWVFVPKSDQVQNGKMYAHIAGFTPDQDGDYAALYGETVELVPGEWTPVFWEGTYSVQIIAKNFHFISRERKLHQWHLQVWSDVPYTDSIYIDDIVMWTRAASTQ